MSTKTLLPIPILTAGDMSGNLTSKAIPLQFEDNVGLQFVWTGSPVGTIQVQVTLDDPTGAVVNWTTIPASAFVGTYPVPGTTTSPAYLDMALLSAAYMQVTYTATSGSGSLSIKAVAKGV